MMSTPVVEAGPRSAAIATPQWIVFTCAGHRFAVPLRRVKAILPPRTFTRLPGCGPEVCGLVSLRGRIVTVFDLGAALLLGPSVAKAAYRLLYLEFQDGFAGLAVDEVVGIARSEAEELPVTTDALRSLDVDRDDLIGIGAHDGVPFLALDPNRILRRLLA